MTLAEEKTLIMLAHEPDGVYASPAIPEFVEVLKSLEQLGFAKAAQRGENVVYRITMNGSLALYTEGNRFDSAAKHALGVMHEQEKRQLENLFKSPTFERPLADRLVAYERCIARSKALFDAYDSVEWGEFGPRKKVRE